MAEQDLARMMQTTLDLMTIFQGHQDHSAEDVLAGMMRFCQQIETSRDGIAEQLRGQCNPEQIHDLMMRPNALAMRFGANDFIRVNTRAAGHFADILGVEGAELSPEIRADISIWLAISSETVIAVKLLFQTARLYGRAPNGKRLGQDA